MRISDWSSDVSSSDLRTRLVDQRLHVHRLQPQRAAAKPGEHQQVVDQQGHPLCRAADHLDVVARLFVDAIAQRSEEHTSELQSLMRISYAVFCLKKKKY